MRSRLALALLLLLLAPAAGVAPGALSARSPGGDAPTADLPPGAAPIVELLRREPTDPDRLARVLRWTRENGGPLPIGAALAAAPRDPLDRFVAGLLLDAGGRPDIALGVLREACSLAPSAAPSSGAPASEAVSSEAALLLAQLWVRAGRPDLAAALPLYALRRRVLLQLAVLATLTAVATSSVLALSPLPPPPRGVGAGIIGLGLAWLLLGIGGWLPPAIVAEATGAVVMLIGSQAMSADEPRWLGLALGVAIAATLVFVAVRTDTRHPLLIGAFALFVITPQLVFELFEDTIGAPATLLVTGLLLVLLAVGLSPARRDVV
ncbi:MAG: hypothetical protein ACO4CW_03580, partial [Planctomycetota bacterium]